MIRQLIFFFKANIPTISDLNNFLLVLMYKLSVISPLKIALLFLINPLNLCVVMLIFCAVISYRYNLGDQNKFEKWYVHASNTKHFKIAFFYSFLVRRSYLLLSLKWVADKKNELGEFVFGIYYIILLLAFFFIFSILFYSVLSKTAYLIIQSTLFFASYALQFKKINLFLLKVYGLISQIMIQIVYIHSLSAAFYFIIAIILQNVVLFNILLVVLFIKVVNNLIMTTFEHSNIEDALIAYKRIVYKQASISYVKLPSTAIHFIPEPIKSMQYSASLFRIYPGFALFFKLLSYILPKQNIEVLKLFFGYTSIFKLRPMISIYKYPEFMFDYFLTLTRRKF